VMFVYVVLNLLRREKMDMRCLDTVGLFLLVAMIVDFAFEGLEYIHRLYQSEESIRILGELVSQRLFTSLVVVQVALGMLLPLLILSLVRSKRISASMRAFMYFVSVLLVEVGIFAMRWNVVIGGQEFSKSLRGLMTYRIESTGMESLTTALVLLSLPFIILVVLHHLLPTRWMEEHGFPAH